MKKKEVDIFSDTLNHDTKSLLMSIKAYAQLLLKKTKPSLEGNIFDYLIRLDKQVDALIELVARQDRIHIKQKKVSQRKISNKSHT